MKYKTEFSDFLAKNGITIEKDIELFFTVEENGEEQFENLIILALYRGFKGGIELNAEELEMCYTEIEDLEKNIKVLSK